MIEGFIEHCDAIIVFDRLDGSTVCKNSEFRKIFAIDIKNIEDFEPFFLDYYHSSQTPILNLLELNNISYLVKRKVAKSFIIYHFESNNYYLSMIENIKKQVSIDDLTGCYNKKEFEIIIKRMLSTQKRYSGSNFAAIMLDIDYFKKINDKYGHLAGDFILKEMSLLIHNGLRDSDIFARVGGEEFVVLLPRTKLNGALKTAEKICRAVKEHKFNFNGEIISLTISLGITSTMNGDTYFSILDRIDKALYKAKNSGRNRVEYF